MFIVSRKIFSPLYRFLSLELKLALIVGLVVAFHTSLDAQEETKEESSTQAPAEAPAADPTAAPEVDTSVSTSLPPTRSSSGGASSSGSSMPGVVRESGSSGQQIDPVTGEPIETLTEMEVKERAERDVSELLEDPIILKQGRERDRELIDKYMDDADKILNTFTIPFIGMSLAARAAEERRMEEIQSFEDEQKSQLEAIKRIDKDYYKERSAEYYDTMIRMREGNYTERDLRQ